MAAPGDGNLRVRPTNRGGGRQAGQRRPSHSGVPRDARHGCRLGQECVRITAADFRSMIFSTQYRVPEYQRWLLHQADMASAYRYHRMFLQYLQSAHSAERWVIKSPAHLWSLRRHVPRVPGGADRPDPSRSAARSFVRWRRSSICFAVWRATTFRSQRSRPSGWTTSCSVWTGLSRRERTEPYRPDRPWTFSSVTFFGTLWPW